MRVALLLTGMGAMMVSFGPAAATTTKHTKNSSAKPPTNGTSKSPTTTKKSGTTRSGASNSGAAKSPGTKSTGGKLNASKTGKRTGKKSTGRQRGQMAPTPERITEIQQALAKNGAFAGVPSGKWDDSTADAMRKFQAAHGLNPSGKLDAPTLNHLGLGAATAGAAPPTPMVRTSSVVLPADIQH